MSEHEEEEDEFKFLEALRDMLAPKKIKFPSLGNQQLGLYKIPYFITEVTCLI